jgi:hypothetical protein
MVVALAAAGTQDSGGGGVHTNNWLIGVGSASVQDRPVQVKTCPGRRADVLEIMLVSRCAGTIDRTTVCGLLSECLHDALVLDTFNVCYLVLNSRLFLR